MRLLQLRALEAAGALGSGAAVPGDAGVAQPSLRSPPGLIIRGLITRLGWFD